MKRSDLDIETLEKVRRKDREYHALWRARHHEKYIASSKKYQAEYRARQRRKKYENVLQLDLFEIVPGTEGATDRASETSPATGGHLEDDQNHPLL